MNDWRVKEDYKDMLTLIASLSRLFSSNKIPFIYYRATENIFCKYCEAKNLARDDTAYDAKIDDLGIGIKTFQVPNGKSIEKIAEFNKLSSQLKVLNDYELAYKLAEFRNERMLSANSLYGINKSIYHIIGRSEGKLEIFDSDYDFVDKNTIKVVKDNDTSLIFKDIKHEYTFNKSKSVLMKKFIVPENRLLLPIKIIEDPYELLKTLIKKKDIQQSTAAKYNSYVILPLFSTRGSKDGTKIVPQKSGLNQWNAGGRLRDYDEVYIQIPKQVHKENPGFFPCRDVQFTLHLPNDKDTLVAKVCQDNDKALMSNPNKALGKWILRDVLRLKQGELLTYDRLEMAGFDSLAENNIPYD